MQGNSLKIVAAIILLSGAVWLSIFYTNWFISEGSSRGLVDLVSGKPAIALSFEISEKRLDSLRKNLELKMSQQKKVSASWASKLSDANVLLVAITDWRHSVFLKQVPGLEESSLSAQKLTPADDRVIFTLSQGGRVALVVVIYMSPRLNDKALECISNDFVRILTDTPANESNPIQACLNR